MRQDTTQAISSPHRCLLTRARCCVIVAACFMLYVAGCAHKTAELPSAPQKPPVIEKHVSPEATRAPDAAEPDTTRAVEKKTKEKKSTVASDKIPDKRLEQPEESTNSDTFVPPPPLKPPTFGGAGG